MTSRLSSCSPTTLAEKDKRTATEVTKKFWSVGASAPVSAAGTSAEYAKYKTDVAQTTTKVSAGYTHVEAEAHHPVHGRVAYEHDDAVGVGIDRGVGIGANGENITGLAAGFNHKF